MLIIGLSNIAFIMLRYVPSNLNFFRAFNMKACWIWQTWDNHVFMSLWRVMSFIMFIDLHTLNCLRVLPEWSQFDNDQWSFWWILEFCWQVFCWEFFHLCSSGRWVCNFFVVHFSSFGIRITSFMKKCGNAHSFSVLRNSWRSTGVLFLKVVKFTSELTWSF